MSSPDSPLPRLYILITGSNSGVGLGIATRILLQLSSPSRGAPSDSFAQTHPFPLSSFPSPSSSSPTDCPYTPNSGVTIILACRSEARAMKARDGMLSQLDKHFLERNGVGEEDREFKKQLEIVWEGCDLSEMREVYGFVDRVKSKYPYLTHLYLNAGVGAWGPIYWPGAFYEFFTSPINALTDPQFKLQETGWKSDKDGLGWVWQCGVFGHWCIANSLLPLLLASPFPSRTIWTSSHLTSVAPKLDLTDIQCVRTAKSYEISKRQIDLLSTELDRRLRAEGGEGRSIVCDPAVTATEIYRPQLGVVLYQLMMLAFYMVRFLGNSPNHPIDVLTGTIAFVHLGLLPTSLLPSPTASIPSSTSSSERTLSPADHTPSLSPSASSSSLISSGPPATPADSNTNLAAGGIEEAYKFRSQADRWGQGYVRVAEYEVGVEERRELVRLVEEERGKWERALGDGPGVKK